MENFQVQHIPLLSDEHWWGGCAADGPQMPYSAAHPFSQDLTINPTPNQAVPFLVSDQGRYVWSETGFAFSIADGRLSISYEGKEPILREGFDDLRTAYRAACAAHFPPSGTAPARQLFEGVQYCSWIEMMYYPSQAKILEYADRVLDNHFPAGSFIIDCGWQDYFGKWRFNHERFPDPAAMITGLHERGFAVLLWFCPFVSADSVEYRFLRDKGFLVRDESGAPSIKKWWDGFSAVLDFSNPGAIGWLEEQIRFLMDTYGIDGVKMDAGDAYFYSPEDVTFAPIDPNGQCESWAKFGIQFAYNEYRTCFKCGGQPLVQRLADKEHSWGASGVAALIPSLLAQGTLGYPYSSPDLIGGGEYLNFLANADKLDPELFVRHAQAAALLPIMQFSAAPWRVLSEPYCTLCQQAVQLHMQYAGRILALIDHARQTGEPLVRWMEYVFPHQGMAEIRDQFMLGDDILVAPVLKKGAENRLVTFPQGTWLGDDGSLVTGPCSCIIDTPLARLPLYTQQKGRL